MSSTSEAEQATEKLVAAMLHAWNVHDAHTFASVFAEDADFTNIFGMDAQGREEIELFHRSLFATMFRKSRLRAMSTRTRAVRPDVATVDIHWEMSGACDPEGNPWPSRSGLINLLITREKHAWSIAVMHNMELPMDGMAGAQADLQKRHRPAGAGTAEG
jgi:uncharacterized protein (TIGR02246 family)